MQTTLGEMVDFVGGSQPPKSTFSDIGGEDYIRLIQIRDYKSDKHITYIPKGLAKRFCSKTDVMIGRYGPPIFQILRGLEGAYNVALMKAVPRSASLDLEYLFYYLKQDILLKYVEAGSDRTAGQDGVRKELLLPYPFFLPHIDEQTEIVRRVEQLFTYADQIEQRVKDAQARVNHLTQSILAKAFRGELTADWRAQNSDLISGENSAEALLAKIQAQRLKEKPKTGRKARA
jgi:type I restriction enzyme S subunit